jgi:hypothetical protein
MTLAESIREYGASHPVSRLELRDVSASVTEIFEMEGSGARG